jgi:hypothetical protein
MRDLIEWLDGGALDDATLRNRVRDLLEESGRLERRAQAFVESARLLEGLLSAWARQASDASAVFGEWHSDRLWRGYHMGRGSLARIYGRQLELLGNLVRARAWGDVERE